ncbi:MAG: DsbA family oxidoreductase [Actinobacteria bacterium]|nr:DsbA family oxidoreductase [Actinomycetota bacterium]
MSVEVWSDVVCPWCCIGRAHLERALAQFAHADQVEVRFRSFELDPNAANDSTRSVTEDLARKYGRSEEEILAMQAQITERAARVGLEFHLDRVVTCNSLDAHRLLHLAADRGRQADLVQCLFRAYFADGASLGDPDVLTHLAVDCGLDEGEVRDVLSTDRYLDAVRADEAEARALQVGGVPFFVFDRRLARSGAQPPEVLLSALEQAWQARTPTSA